jgi:hypothetical protein
MKKHKTGKMRRTALLGLAAAVLWSGAALAQYKCVVGGKTVYADEPCATNAKHVGALEDRVDSRAQADAELLRRKEAMQRGRIDRQENAEFQGQQRAAQRYVANEQQAAADAERARRQRCAQLERDMKLNQRGVARYQDFGWQRSLTNEEQELKRNQEAHSRECR